MIKKITPEELINKSPQDIQIIDIREPYELEDGYILGNTNIPMGDILEKIDQLSKTKDIIIYCNTGRRSKPVTYMLKKLHNISVYNLTGGYKNFSKTLLR
jgi:rhodanese-related sulfurtransferase